MRKSVKSMLSPFGQGRCPCLLAGDVRVAGCLLQFELGLEILFFRFLFIFRLF